MKKSGIVWMAVLLFIAAAPAYAAGSDAVIGKWWNQEKDAQIEIYTCNGKFCGRIVWLKEPVYPQNDPRGMGGKPKVDRENPDVAKRSRFLMGLNILWGFVPSGENRWEGGYIYNPKEGKTYKCRISMDNPDHLKVRGFVGISLIGKTNDWTRVK
ncbi:MAG: DUF2147 domain-containing protein [Syntrophales bacterium]